MIVSCHAKVGGLLQLSVTNAVHASFFEVARILAEQLLWHLPIVESTLKAGVVAVPKITLPPGATLTDDIAGSLDGPPPTLENRSMPTSMVAVSVDVQEKYVSWQSVAIIPGTE
jgi:hypothetical protein